MYIRKICANKYFVVFQNNKKEEKDGEVPITKLPLLNLLIIGTLTNLHRKFCRVGSNHYDYCYVVQ